ncbi:iron chelate uptake ABC transporter family permease subunit [Melioribacteraceae bacterium 4301-Me]|uniref:iron chelate uptake ABC transporter family permease subunit n=1 Tax=Pyranulibacter aquaticus TaxID=3163344 RepID=UPI00359B3E72
MSLSKKDKYIALFLVILFLISFTLDVVLGPVKIPLGVVVKIILGSNELNSTWSTIITEFRLPKAITAVLAGSALSVCGLIMQTFFRNPLADPFVLGISSGASFGVALVILTAGSFGINLFFLGGLIGNLSITIAAILGALIVLLVIMIIARKISNNITLLILGLMIGYVISSIENFLKFFSSPENLQGYVIWGMGNFGNVVWKDLYFLIPVIFIGLAFSFILSKQLNLLLLGENYAKSLGVRTNQMRIFIIVIAGVLGGAITAFCGPIAFVGIAVPHVTKNLLNHFDHKILIPSVALSGSILTLICDILSQLPGGSQTIPINTVTSLLGAPIVIWIIIKQRKTKYYLVAE